MKDIYNSLSKKLMQAKQSKAKRREEKRIEETLFNQGPLILLDIC
jgi:hypothetical protein